MRAMQADSARVSTTQLHLTLPVLLHYVQKKYMYSSCHAVLISHFLSAVDENSQAQEVRLQSWADCSSQIQTIEDELKTCVLSLKEQVKNAIQRSKQS